MKSNLITAKAEKIGKDKNGLNIQNVTILDGTETLNCALPTKFVPFAKYGTVVDKFGIQHILLKKNVDEYHGKEGVITIPNSEVLPIPEGTILIGFVRRPNRYYSFTRFIPVIALLEENPNEYVVYDFNTKSKNEIFTQEHNRRAFPDFKLFKDLALRNYCFKFNRVYKNTEAKEKWFTEEELKKLGVKDLSNWEIKLI